jgi:hypothetical protein
MCGKETRLKYKREYETNYADQKCSCGGNLSRAMPLFCPNCSEKKYGLNMNAND